MSDGFFGIIGQDILPQVDSSYSKVKYENTEVISAYQDRDLLTGAPGWTLGASWSISQPNLVRAANGTLTTAVHSGAVTPGKKYQIWLTVVSGSSSVHQFGIGGVLVSLPTTSATTATAIITAVSASGFTISSNESSGSVTYTRPYAREILSSDIIPASGRVSLTEDLVSDWSADSCYKDAAKTLPCSSDGDVIYTIADIVSGYDMVQATLANRPIFRKTEDGYRSIRMHKISSTASCASGTWPAPCTVYLVFRPFLPFAGSIYDFLITSAVSSFSPSISHSYGRLTATVGSNLTGTGSSYTNYDHDWLIAAYTITGQRNRLAIYNRDGLLSMDYSTDPDGLGSFTRPKIGHASTGSVVDFSRILIYSRAHSTYEEALIAKQLKGNMPYSPVSVTASKSFSFGSGTALAFYTDNNIYNTAVSRQPLSNKVYFLGTTQSVAGGTVEWNPANNPTYTLNFWSYDTSTGTFTQLSSPAATLFSGSPTANNCYGQGLVAYSGVVYAFAGYSAVSGTGTANRKTLSYTIGTDTWTNGAVTDFPVTASDADAVLIGSVAYIFNNSDAKFYSIDLTTPLVAYTVSTACAGGGGAYSLVTDGVRYLYLVSRASGTTTTPYRYDTVTSTWTTLTSLPVSLSGAGVVYASPYIYVIGGRPEMYYPYASDNILRYDTTGGATGNPWISVKLLPTSWALGHAIYDGANIVLFNGVCRNSGGGTLSYHTSVFKLSPP